MTDRNDPAAPTLSADGNWSKHCNGITAAEHAALMLRVPESGTPWIDAMIIKARRMDAAQAAMQGLTANAFRYIAEQRAAGDQSLTDAAQGMLHEIGVAAGMMADALMAAMVKP